ncbi:hypothetical protein ON010_g6637 [Phytophthora cinnamomi]|nr:hypothetical protein ON010_g6637 [Phytophthora cinnamomi]
MKTIASVDIFTAANNTLHNGHNPLHSQDDAAKRTLILLLFSQCMPHVQGNAITTHDMGPENGVTGAVGFSMQIGHGVVHPRHRYLPRRKSRQLLQVDVGLVTMTLVTDLRGVVLGASTQVHLKRSCKT